MSNDLRTATIRLAASLPAGSQERLALLQVLVASEKNLLIKRHPDVITHFKKLKEGLEDLGDLLDHEAMLLNQVSSALADESDDEAFTKASNTAGYLAEFLEGLKRDVYSLHEKVEKSYRGHGIK